MAAPVFFVVVYNGIIIAEAPTTSAVYQIAGNYFKKHGIAPDSPIIVVRVPFSD